MHPLRPRAWLYAGALALTVSACTGTGTPRPGTTTTAAPAATTTGPATTSTTATTSPTTTRAPATTVTTVPSGCPPRPRIPTAAPLVGVYTGNDPKETRTFESWLGHPVDGILGYTGAADWSDYDGSVGWAIGVWGALDRPVLWSVPLIPKGADLETAAKGSYNDHYRAAAQKLAATRPNDPIIHVRTAWEFNGDWFPWTAKGKPEAFKSAFRQFADIFHSVSNRFVIEWNVNIGDTGMNPETAYPGDCYVDVIGMDFYWNTAWDPKDPNAAWQSMLDRPWGLNWHQNYAAAHHKPTSYSEWGVDNNAAAPYIDKARRWFADHQVVFQTYWDSNNAFTGKLSSGQFPATGAAYRAAFG